MMRGRLFNLMTTVLLATILSGISAFMGSHPVRAQDAEVQYTIKNIGVIEGDTGSFVFAINEKGVAVGLSINADKGTNRAVTYRKGKLSDLTGGDERTSTVWAVNKAGQGAGFFADTPQTSGAAVWDGKKTTVLPKLGGDIAQAFGIYDDGVVVGGSNTSEGGAVLACRWDDGKVTALPSAGDSSVAQAINNRGQIVGSGFGSHATLWDGDKVTDLGTLGGTTSLGRSINERGQIIGHSTTTEDGTFGLAGTHAFLWEDGAMTDLGTLPGSEISFGWDINADGVVAGSAGAIEPPADPNQVALLAVIWQDGKIVNLNDLIPADSGWVLTTAYGINDAGQIVGYGYNKGRQRGFVLTPIKS
jgi:probable HAF family extracellular repeat protein